MKDVRYGLRQLRRSPGFTSAAVVTLALGIGANTAVFSVIDATLIEPLPYDAPSELVTVSTAFPTMDFDRFWISPPEFFELREWNQAFSEVGAYRTTSASIETDARPLRVAAAVASWTLFPTLGVEARLGRTFSSEEDLPGAPPVAVISDGLWRRAFGSDPGILGRTVRIDGVATEVVGVMPPRFDVEDAGVDVWAPLNIDPDDHVNRRGNHFLNLVARLRPGVTLDRAQADLDRIEVRSNEAYGDTHALDPQFHPMSASSFEDDVVGDVRADMWLLQGSVFFVLLIACANVANLLLARSESRSKEMAVRVAMGAGRTRLVRQLLVEGMTLSTIGAVFGIGLGYYALRGLLRVNPDGVPRVDEIGLDGTVVLFTASVAVLTGLVFGLAPLLSSTLARVGGTLKEAGARTTQGVAASRVRRLLIVGEVALAVMLLTGAGLLLRSMGELRQVDVGFDIDDLLTMEVSLPAADYPETSDVGSFFTSALERIRALPGVTSATTMSGLPPLRSLNANDTQFEGLEQSTDGPPQNVDYWTAIDSDFAETMGVEIVEGRGFEPSDALAETPVMLVNQRLARTFYPGDSPLGRRIRPPGGGAWFTVVGVVADMKQAGIANEAGTELFFYAPQISQSGVFAYRTQNLFVRTEGDPLALAGPVTAVLADLDSALPVSNVQSMEQRMAEALAQPRFMTLLLTLFAGVALALAGIGTYGVMSYSVAERNREIGIRLAMGAERGSVLGMVLRQGGGLALLGLFIGVAGSFALTRLLASQLYEVSPTDARTFVLAPLFLAFVSLAACWLPAQRATAVDPVAALRSD
ncbi:MAG: ABC transporter permease [Gemmatimonadota bacterium]